MIILIKKKREMKGKMLSDLSQAQLLSSENTHFI